VKRFEAAYRPELVGRGGLHRLSPGGHQPEVTMPDILHRVGIKATQEKAY